MTQGVKLKEFGDEIECARPISGFCLVHLGSNEMLRVLGAVVTTGPRTLKYQGNPQILDGRLKVQMGRVRTSWGAPVDVERHW